MLWDTPAAVRFLSAEPLLEPIDLGGQLDGIDIVGGESGRGARMMRPEWARSLRDQRAEAGMAFHFKQTGTALARAWGQRKGTKPCEWPEPFPRSAGADAMRPDAEREYS